ARAEPDDIARFRVEVSRRQPTAQQGAEHRAAQCGRQGHQKNPARRHDRSPRVDCQPQLIDALRPRIMSEALSAIISVEALRLAEIIRGMIEASITRRFCKPCTRNWSSTTAHELSAGPIRQVQPGWNVVVPRWVAACRNSSSLCTF